MWGKGDNIYNINIIYIIYCGTTGIFTDVERIERGGFSLSLAALSPFSGNSSLYILNLNWGQFFFGFNISTVFSSDCPIQLKHLVKQ